jgi:hypothetical protein
LTPVFISAIVWIWPWGEKVRRGFNEPSHLTASGAFFLVAWYATVALAATAGYVIGRSSPPLTRLNDVPDDAFYYRLTVIAACGVGWTYLEVARTNPGLVLSSFEHGQFNLVRQAVPYAAGPQTLRYAAVVSGAIALHRIVRSRERRVVHIVNIGLLISTAALASRLSLVLAGVLFVGLILRSNPNARFSWRAVIIGVTVFVLLTTELNAMRNRDFYKEKYGVTNVFLMNAYETIAYVGAPFQVSVSVASQAAHDFVTLDQVVAGVRDTVTPSYVPGRPNVQDEEQSYRAYTDVEESLTTNSALAMLYSILGLYAFPLATFVVLIGGLVAGHASQYRSYFCLTSFAVSYCFLEFWRTYLFNEGIIQFCVLVLIVVPLTIRSSRRHDAAARGLAQASAT